METSAPGTSQQNGVAERMNKTLKEHVKALLAHVTAKQSLWKEALQTALIHYNLGSVTGRSVTPYEAFTGAKPSVAALRSWGYKALLLLQQGKTTATGPRSVPVMWDMSWDPRPTEFLMGHHSRRPEMSPSWKSKTEPQW